ncbi:hypothetical protein K474DRAFT_1680888 [Panus rudis PR-1116 ss-1]|nr:hypothetical protein K474DRAFT_1680888 [Panus rudis PR-1116 ss-1]
MYHRPFYKAEERTRTVMHELAKTTELEEAHKKQIAIMEELAQVQKQKLMELEERSKAHKKELSGLSDRTTRPISPSLGRTCPSSETEADGIGRAVQSPQEGALRVIH